MVIMKYAGIVLAALAVAATARILIRELRRTSKTKKAQGKGTITFVDANARQLSIEVFNPSTQLIEEFSGTVPSACQVSINGNIAALEDVRISDTAEIRGRIERGPILADGSRPMQATAEWVRVTRSSPT